MDGNGRWATSRGLPRSAGHSRGLDAARDVVRVASELGVGTLTLFCFSSENWVRPSPEVTFLMGLVRRFIDRDIEELHNRGVRVCVIGSKTDLPTDVRGLLEKAVDLTSANTGLRLVLAFNYGGRDEIVRATRRLAEDVESGRLRSSDINESIFASALDTSDWSDPDLIIRTSGEQRLSNFLLWQSAYTEFVFVDCLWPDFDGNELRSALDEFYSRHRRFGGVTPTSRVARLR